MTSTSRAVPAVLATLFAALASAILAGPAFGATLSTYTVEGPTEGNVLRTGALAKGAPGEANVLEAVHLPGGWQLSDTAGPLTIQGGSDCSPFTGDVGPVAVCQADEIGLQGQDGDDRLRVTGSSDDRATLDGGAGDDTVTGGVESDDIALSDGHDVLDGGTTPDDPYQNDILRVNDAGPATVDLAAGTAVQRDRTATLRGFEAVTGDDLIVFGDDGRNLLTSGRTADGRGGNDVLAGAGTLHGGPGDDWIEGTGTVFGDEGDDTFQIPYARRSTPAVSCGPGRDLVAPRDEARAFTLASDCERLALSVLAPRPNIVLDPVPRRVRQGRALTMTLRCDGRRTCHGTLRLRTAGGVSRTLAVAVPFGHSRSFTIPAPGGRTVRAGATVVVAAGERGGASHRWSVPAR